MNVVMDVLKEGLMGSLSSMWGGIKIVVPLMLAIEIIKDLKILDKISGVVKPITKVIGTTKDSLLPLLSGLLFGILYGAGIIVDSVNEGNMDKKEVYLVTIFLGACHAIVEDTLIFTQIGANGWVIFFARLVTAIIITSLAARTRYFRLEKSIDI